MKIKRIDLDGYKNLNGINIDINDNSNALILIGDNGSGKTNMIEAIVKIIDGSFGTFRTNENVFDYNNVRYRIRYECYGQLNELTDIDTIEKIENQKNTLPHNIVLYSAGDSKRIYELIYEKKKRISDINLLNLNYYTQKMLVVNWLIENKFDGFTLEYIVMHLKPTSFENLIEKSLNNKSINKNFTLFLMVLKNKISNFTRNTTMKIELHLSELQQIYREADQDLFVLFLELEKQNVFSNYKKSNTDYLEIFLDSNKDNEIIEFSAFGEGTQLLMSLYATVAKFNKEETLFIMDEPDCFIHPRNVNKLVEVISNSDNQFILTTHSPKLISRIENATVYRLNRDSKSNHNYYGRRIDYLYEDLMDFDSHPNEIKIEIKSIDALIQESKFEIAKSRLSKLEQVLGENDTDVTTLRVRLSIMEKLSND